MAGLSRQLSAWAKFKSFSSAKTALDSNPSQDNALRYFQSLVDADPRQTIVAIEKGWGAGKFPVNNEFCSVYFKAAAKLGRLDHINYNSLLALMAANQNGTHGSAQAMLSQPEIAALIQNARLSTTASVGGAAASGAGQSPEMPLHVVK